jgi:hypothetical protein
MFVVFQMKIIILLLAIIILYSTDFPDLLIVTLNPFVNKLIQYYAWKHLLLPTRDSCTDIFDERKNSTTYNAQNYSNRPFDRLNCTNNSFIGHQIV